MEKAASTLKKEILIRHMTNTGIRKITFAGVTAALYAALTIASSPIAYGAIQFRISEVLCILPFFFPFTVPGLFVGCIIANLFSPYGILDLAVGSAATLAAALVTMKLGKAAGDRIVIKALACFPPVIFNALMIGAVIAWSTVGAGDPFLPAFAINGLRVGFGEFIIMYVLGLPLMVYLPKTNIYTFLTKQYGGAI